jgi:hypothetical protein
MNFNLLIFLISTSENLIFNKGEETDMLKGRQMKGGYTKKNLLKKLGLGINLYSNSWDGGTEDEV